MTDLDTEFTFHNIEQALVTVKSGKAADCLGDVAEFFTRAKLPDSDSFLLAPHLTRIFIAIFCSGKFRSTESMRMITQIDKGKGDTGNCTNYRGITIISVLSKIYAILLNTSLASLRIASPSRRAKGHSGFLADYRTVDHICFLRHFNDK